MKIGEKLRGLRIEEGLTQQYMADYLGCKRQTYTRYENDQREIDLDSLCKIADLFDVSVDFILGRKKF
ncbi:MAG: helix-turn-helix domain-containing protein [Christensenellales bacterium]